MPTLVMDLRDRKWYVFHGFVEKEIADVTYKQSVTHARTLPFNTLFGDKAEKYHYIPVNMAQFSTETRRVKWNYLAMKKSST